MSYIDGFVIAAPTASRQEIIDERNKAQKAKVSVMKDKAPAKKKEKAS